MRRAFLWLLGFWRRERALRYVRRNLPRAERLLVVINHAAALEAARERARKDEWQRAHTETMERMRSADHRAQEDDVYRRIIFNDWFRRHILKGKK